MRSADECEMSRSCQSGSFSSPRLPRRGRPARARRSVRRRPGSACAASRRSLSALAERLLDLPHLGASEVPDLEGEASSDEAATARAASSSAWRSRCRYLGGGRGRLESEPLAGDPLQLGVGCRVGADCSGELADAHAVECPPTRARARSSSKAQPASLRPNVVGSACTPCVRPMQSVMRCCSARAATAANARPSPSRISAPGGPGSGARARCRRRRTT